MNLAPGGGGKRGSGLLTANVIVFQIGSKPHGFLDITYVVYYIDTVALASTVAVLIHKVNKAG